MTECTETVTCRHNLIPVKATMDNIIDLTTDGYLPPYLPPPDTGMVIADDMTAAEAYGVDDVDIHAIELPLIQGRLPSRADKGQPRLIGSLDMTKGVLRVDSLTYPEFWIEINLGELPIFKYSPERIDEEEELVEAKNHFESK